MGENKKIKKDKKKVSSSFCTRESGANFPFSTSRKRAVTCRRAKSD